MADTSSTVALLALVTSFAWTAALASVMPYGLRKMGLTRRNFRGDEVVTAGGIILILGALPVLAYLSAGPARSAFSMGLVGALASFGLLGLQDDLFGSAQARGLRGHLRALLKERRVTSGLVKAAGGVIAAAVIAIGIYAASGPTAAAMTLIIALGANAGNLLDLRPGRAGAAAMAGMAVACVALLATDGRPSALCVVCLCISTAVVYRHDARGWLMLGDTGSNALGACTALALHEAFPSAVIRIGLLASLIALHVIAERYSLSAIIERNRLLRWLDGLTGVR